MDSSKDESGHGDAKYDSEDEEELPIACRQRVENCHPQAGEGCEESGGYDKASCDPVPVLPALAKGRDELECTEQGVHDGAHDMGHNWDGRVEESGIAFCHIAPAVSSVSRAAPASTGIKLRRINPAGTTQPGRPLRAVAAVAFTCVFCLVAVTEVLILEPVDRCLLKRPSGATGR